MKLKCESSREHGSVLMVTLFIATMFGLFLFSYLYLVRNQKAQITRSQAWNASLVMAEAGIEEAMAQLNPHTPQPMVDRTANGWGSASAGIYGPRNRTYPSGRYSVVYTTDLYPVLYSTGYVSVPSIPATLARGIRVVTTNVPLFTVAMAALGNINFNGNGVNTDSFNSSSTNLSLNGRYDSSRVSTNGDVASVAGLVNVGNANINGTLLLGPSASDSIQNNGYVSGGITNDFNYVFPDVTLPTGSASWLTPVSGSTPIGGVTYNYVFTTSGDYQLPSLGGNVYVATNVAVRLLINGNASPSTITVAGPGSGARLTIYMNGPSFTLSGGSTVDGGSAMNLSYFGTTNNTFVTMSGNAAFTGTLYAPEAALTLGGGGNNTYDFVGSTITKTVTINGHFNFHFDEALLAQGPVRGYAATSWRELSWLEL